MSLSELRVVAGLGPPGPTIYRETGYRASVPLGCSSDAGPQRQGHVRFGFAFPAPTQPLTQSVHSIFRMNE